MRTKSATRLLVSIHYSLVIAHELYLICTTIHVNLYTACILILMCSSCTRQHDESYLWIVSRHIKEHKCFCKLRRELYCNLYTCLWKFKFHPFGAFIEQYNFLTFGQFRGNTVILIHILVDRYSLAPSSRLHCTKRFTTEKWWCGIPSKILMY